jgi:uroporphyrinogen decarboxylase
MGVQVEKDLAEQGIDWRKLRNEVNDIDGFGPEYIGPKPPENTDIWGIRRKEMSYGGGSYQEFEYHPLAGMERPEQLESVTWPDPEAYDYESLKDKTGADIDRDKAVKMFSGNPFEIYCWMTGLEESLINVLVNPDFVRSALDKITGYFEHKLKRVIENSGDWIDIFFFADDLGGQTGLLMSRQAYRDVLQPFHSRLFSLAKKLSPDSAVMMHSDGAVFDVLPDVMEAGMEVLEAVQVDAEGMAPERLKAAYGDRLAFHGGISVQALLPRNDAATVEKECRRLVEVFGEDGAYIAAPSHAIQVGTPVENIPAMLRGVLGEEDYDRAIEAARI